MPWAFFFAWHNVVMWFCPTVCRLFWKIRRLIVETSSPETPVTHDYPWAPELSLIVRGLHSSTWQKPERLSGEADRQKLDMLFFFHSVGGNETTRHSLACWWAAHLLSYHGNSPSPCGFPSSIPAAGVWLNGCQVARRMVTYGSRALTDTLHAEAGVQGNKKRKKGFVCVQVCVCTACFKERVSGGSRRIFFQAWEKYQWFLLL